MTNSIGILGAGYAVPRTIRRNDDPIFDGLRNSAAESASTERDLFTGARERRVLQPHESIEDLMTQAAIRALEQSELAPRAIDRLYGYSGVSEYVAPNGLYLVHQHLGLRSDVLVTSINTEFTNFTKSLLLAWEAIQAGHCQYALVVVGSGLSRNVDYRAPHSFQIGDGAGAVVLGPSSRMSLVDYRCGIWSDDYGLMNMKYRSSKYAEPEATYRIEPEGRATFLERGMHCPPALVSDLLKAHSLHGDDISLMVHQASERLLDFWQKQIHPQALLTTFPFFGHMPIANHAVNLAYFGPQIGTQYLVISSLGVPTHMDAVLIRV